MAKIMSATAAVMLVLALLSNEALSAKAAASDDLEIVSAVTPGSMPRAMMAHGRSLNFFFWKEFVFFKPILVEEKKKDDKKKDDKKKDDEEGDDKEDDKEGDDKEEEKADTVVIVADKVAVDAKKVTITDG